MMNHSCVTNTKTIIDSADGGHLLTTLATRDISRGEQITNQVQGDSSSQDTVMSLSLSPCHLANLGQPPIHGLAIIPTIQHIVIRDMGFPFNKQWSSLVIPVCFTNNDDDNN